MTVTHATDTLARYRVAYEPDDRHIRDVPEPRLFGKRYPAPQPFLGALAVIEWHAAQCPTRYHRSAKPFLTLPLDGALQLSRLREPGER